MTEKEREARLAAQKDGFLLDKGYLYAVDETGELRSNTYVGVLYFREDGRYTSGSEDLDRMVAGAIRKSTDEKMTRMDMLRAMYEYTRDHIKYVGFGNHEDSYRAAHGKDGWMVESATYALENGTGNCYHFAATFAALARGVGFQAYAASGLIGSEDQEHGWVEIVDDSGEVWYSDPETEYARSYWMDQKYDLFYKSKDEIGSVTGASRLNAGLAVSTATVTLGVPSPVTENEPVKPFTRPAAGSRTTVVPSANLKSPATADLAAFTAWENGRISATVLNAPPTIEVSNQMFENHALRFVSSAPEIPPTAFSLKTEPNSRPNAMNTSAIGRLTMAATSRFTLNGSPRNSAQM